MNGRRLKFLATLAIAVSVLALIWLGFHRIGGGIGRDSVPGQPPGMAEEAPGPRAGDRTRKQRTYLPGSPLSKLTLNAGESGIIHLPATTMQEICRRLESSHPGLLAYADGPGMIGGVHSLPYLTRMLGDLEVGHTWISEGAEFQSHESGLTAMVQILGDDGVMVDTEIKIRDQGQQWISSSMTLARGNGLIFWSGDLDTKGVLVVLGPEKDMTAGPGNDPPDGEAGARAIR